jgi:hypothetical protein
MTLHLKDDLIKINKTKKPQLSRVMLIKSVCYNYKIGLNKTKIIRANHNIEKMRNNLKARV